MDPEAKARICIDAKLEAAGWVIQDRSEFDRTASLGVAVREFMTNSGKEERRLAYVKLIQIFPNSERWENISKSIENEELYSEYDDFLWEIKKAKGWTDFE